MLEWTARWLRSRPASRPLLVCLALIMIAAPISIRADEATIHFDIKAQRLSEALMAFGAQTGAIVIAPSKLTSSKISTPVTGLLTREQALTRMLQGTGLRYETNSDGTILIVRAPRHR
ncbi:MAG: STN domain-containing protein [Proteobacteria bacterium]|nr:STN domain-containing protein [Pseudomonadota bacterium]